MDTTPVTGGPGLTDRLPLPLLILRRKTLAIEQANGPATALLGCPATELAGRNLADLFPGRRSPAIDALRAGRLPPAGPAVLKTPRGSTLAVDMHFFEAEPGGRRLGLLLTSREELRQAQEQARRLEALLTTFRRIKSFSAGEQEQARLLESICADLVRGRGYRAAWIALFNSRREAETFAEAGLGVLPMEENLRRGELCYCARQALDIPGPLLIEKPLAVCGDCPLASIFGQTAGLTVRLECAGRRYGVINAHLPNERAGQAEQQLLTGVAGDLSLVLHSLETEKARREAAAEKERASRLKADFLDLAAHQLRTPMTPLREGIGILLEELAAGLTEEQKKMLSIVRRNGERVDLVVSRLISLQRFSAGLEEFRYEETDPDELLEPVAAALTRSVMLRQLALEVIPHGGLAPVRVDREKLVRAFTMLAEIIISFTPGGQLRLKTGSEDEGGESCLVCETEQTSLAPEDRAFFTRETPTASYRGRKTAGEHFLELALCHEITRRHHGRISTGPFGETGLQVRLCLPAARGEQDE